MKRNRKKKRNAPSLESFIQKNAYQAGYKVVKVSLDKGINQEPHNVRALEKFFKPKFIETPTDDYIYGKKPFDQFIYYLAKIGHADQRTGVFKGSIHQPYFQREHIRASLVNVRGTLFFLFHPNRRAYCLSDLLHPNSLRESK